LDGLDADEVAALPVESLPEFVWPPDGSGPWRLRFTVMPLRPEFRGQAKPETVGIHPMGSAGMGSDDRTLLKALKDKVRYGTLQYPLVIAACVDDTFGFGDTHHRLAALYGCCQGEQRMDGLWIDPKGEARNSRVAGVIIVAQLYPWTVDTAVPEFWHNPGAQQPIGGGPEVFGQQHAHVKDGEINLMATPPSRSVADIFRPDVTQDSERVL
jgi:hypothetical protein